ncbi:hypothetical protein ACCW76_16175 [Pantoea sp. C8B4]|uniref:hypothetical protein n=1 Tax=Pantoea sp. C8B4 TaxID=3243083 RepID=UPI003ED962F8
MKINIAIAIFLTSTFPIKPVLADAHPIRSDPSLREVEWQLGMPLNKSFDLVFAQPTSLEIKISPRNDLNSGEVKHAAIFASFQIDVFPPTRLGLRWTPGNSDVTKTIAKIKGKHNNKHILTVIITTETYKPTKIYDDGWIITNNKMTTLTGSIRPFGDQNVPSDTYTISLDASAFIS